jgi:Flp pilus assembly protein TadB
MGLLVIVSLAALWAAVLLPGQLRARREASGIKSVSAFERSMSTLAAVGDPAGDRASGVEPRRRANACLRRRQRIALMQLGCVTAVCGGLAALAGGPAWAAFGATATALVGYALIVARARAREAVPSRPDRDGTLAHVRIQHWAS